MEHPDSTPLEGVKVGMCFACTTEEGNTHYYEVQEKHILHVSESFGNSGYVVNDLFLDHICAYPNGTFGLTVLQNKKVQLIPPEQMQAAKCRALLFLLGDLEDVRISSYNYNEYDTQADSLLPGTPREPDPATGLRGS